MNSDNGTNFVGAERELREALRTTSFDEEIYQKCQVEGVADETYQKLQFKLFAINQLLLGF